MKSKVNCRQLTFAREYSGLSQTDLARNIKGLSQSNLSKFEKGIGTLSEDVIAQIIEYLRFPIGFYEDVISNKVENAHYRKKASLRKSEKTSIEYSNKLVGYIIDQMAHSVEFPEYSIKEFDLEDGYTTKYVAQFTRKYFGITSGSVKDIISLIERHGIIVVELDYDTDCFDGASFITDGGYRVVIINRSFSNDRKRLTIAHELGHIIMHLSSTIAIPEWRDKEAEAYEFAAEFLMPEDEIKSSLENLKLQYLSELKKYWLTSMASIIRRAKDLGCIDKDRYTFFNVELSRKGYKKSEPINVFIDQPRLFNQSYKLHKNELNYSDQELADVFKLPIDVIDRFCLQPNKVVKLRLSV